MTAKPGRPSEIDALTVVRMRDLNRMPWAAIALALGASRSGVEQAYRRAKGRPLGSADKVTLLRDALLAFRGRSGCFGAGCSTETCTTACEAARSALEIVGKG